jgi:hypothetical protein
LAEYERHQPEKTLLYEVVREQLERMEKECSSENLSNINADEY